MFHAVAGVTCWYSNVLSVAPDGSILMPYIWLLWIAPALLPPWKASPMSYICIPVVFDTRVSDVNVYTPKELKSLRSVIFIRLSAAGCPVTGLLVSKY